MAWQIGLNLTNRSSMIKRVLRLLVLSVLSLPLAACVTASNSELNKDLTAASLPIFTQTLFEPVDVLTESEIFDLTAQQKQHFLSFVEDPKFHATSRQHTVATYMGLLFDQFEFSDRTLTAAEALRTKSGNCLSLTVLTTAFARLAGVDVSYQLLDQNPIYSIDNGLLVTSDHLRAVLRSKLPSTRAYSSVSFTRIDYFDTEGFSYVDNISTEFQLSLFYSNLAVEQLGLGELDVAFSYAKRSLEISQSNASALNTIGLLHARKGDLVAAERIYRYGALNLDKAPVFLRNYSDLLRRQGRKADDLLAFRNNTDSKTHVWDWVRAGAYAHETGDYEQSVSFYQRALRIEPGLHQLYLFASRASLAAGDFGQSRDYLQQAISLSDSSIERKHYKNKLNGLSQ